MSKWTKQPIRISSHVLTGMSSTYARVCPPLFRQMLELFRFLRPRSHADFPWPDESTATRRCKSPINISFSFCSPISFLFERLSQYRYTAIYDDYMYLSPSMLGSTKSSVIHALKRALFTFYYITELVLT